MAANAPRFCSSCGRPVVVTDASFCKECGGALASGLRLRPDLGWNPWMAAGLSVVPGLGHFYKGRRVQAMVWLVAVVLAYTAYPFGYLLHLICAANAALGDAIEFGPRRSSDHAGEKREGGRVGML